MDASVMITSKFTIASMFVATLAWAGVAKAEDPCGAPSELLNSCEVVAGTECHELCQPDAMITSCMDESSAACIDECAGSSSSQCEAACMGSCGADCTQELVSENDQCKIMCSASCSGTCWAGCEQSENKIKCFAGCSQQCSAQCSSDCGGGNTEDGAEDEDEHEQLPPRADPEPEPEPDPLPPRVDPEPEPDPLPPRDIEPQKITELITDIDAGECQRDCAELCTGSCADEVARNCELSCQAEAADSCASRKSDQCHAACDAGGVLACGGQYMAVDNIDACLGELEHEGLELSGPVDSLRDGSQALLDPRTATCSIPDQPKLNLAGALFMLLSFGVGATVLRRR